MTKLIKRITIAAVVLMALIGAGGVVAFAAGFIEWGGRDAYEGAVEDLEGLDARRLEIVTNLDQARDLIADQNTLIDSQKKTISDKEDKIKTQENTINTQKTTINDLTTQVTQLEKDNASHEAFEQLVKTELIKGINAVNGTNGAGPKYREITSLVNAGAEYLGITERLSDVNNAQIAEDQLEQAIKDMKDIKSRTGSLVEDFEDVKLIDIPEEGNPDGDNTSEEEDEEDEENGD